MIILDKNRLSIYFTVQVSTAGFNKNCDLSDLIALPGVQLVPILPIIRFVLMSLRAQKFIR